jgi:hypothetical protein
MRSTRPRAFQSLCRIAKSRSSSGQTRRCPNGRYRRYAVVAVSASLRQSPMPAALSTSHVAPITALALHRQAREHPRCPGLRDSAALSPRLVHAPTDGGTKSKDGHGVIPLAIMGMALSPGLPTRPEREPARACIAIDRSV